MALFPLFVELENRKCIVVGGGKVAARKTETLLRFKADVTVISPAVNERIEELKKEGRLTHLLKTFSGDDLDGAFLAVAATSNRSVNRLVSEEAARRNIFVNVADDAGSCSFVFPSTARKGDIVVGITSSGIYPALSRKIRVEIEKLLDGIDMDGNEISMLKEIRRKAREEIEHPGLRKNLLRGILDEVILNGDLKGKVEEKQQAADRIFSKAKEAFRQGQRE